MKVTKADKEEFGPVLEFIHYAEALLKDGRFRDSGNDWRDWDKDSAAKKTLLDIEKNIRESEGDEQPDNRLILFEFFKKLWNEANECGSFGRIAMNAAVLIDNVCDPQFDYLEYRPEMLEAFREYNKTHDKKIEF